MLALIVAANSTTMYTATTTHTGTAITAVIAHGWVVGYGHDHCFECTEAPSRLCNMARVDVVADNAFHTRYSTVFSSVFHGAREGVRSIMTTQLVTVKLQRPLFSSDGSCEILSYIVDDDDEQTSNSLMEQMSKKMMKKLGLDGHAKVYWLAEYKPGKKLNLLKPTREDEWVKL